MGNARRHGVFTFFLCVITGVLARYTYRLFRVTADLARDTKTASAAALLASTKATKLATKEFISTHRPKLRVRKVVVHPLDDGVPITLQYEIANIGNTAATLQYAEARVEVGKGETHDWGETEGDDPPWFGVGGRIGEGRVIKVGEHLLLKFGTNLNYSSERRFERDRMVIRGQVYYRDENAVERRTEFERFCINGTRHFGRAERPDPDYEHED